MKATAEGDNLHEMSKPIFWEKLEKNIVSLSSTELGKKVVKVTLR